MALDANAILQYALQQKQQRSRNFDQATQFGQNLGEGVGGIVQQIAQAKAKKQLADMLGQPDQIPMMKYAPLGVQPQNPNAPQMQANPNAPNLENLAGPLQTLYPETFQKSLQNRLDPQSQWKVVPSMLSKTGNPLQENSRTGEIREAPFGVTPTGKGNSAFGTGAINLENATPEDLQLARALLERRINPAALGYRDRTVGVKLAELLGQKEGTPFVSYGANVNQKVAEDFAAGKEGRNVLALNTALGHSKSALEAYQNVKNLDVKLLNMPLNVIRKEINNPNIVKLQTSLNALSGELSSVFKGTGGTDQEISHWLNVLSQDLTPIQAQSAIEQVNDLLNSRLDSLQHMRDTGMGKPAASPLLSPKGAELSNEFKKLGQGKKTEKSVVEDGWVYTPGLGGKANKANWKKQ